MKVASAFVCGIIAALLCLGTVAEAQPAPPDAYPAPPPTSGQPPPPPPPGYQQPPPGHQPPPPPPPGYYRPGAFRPLPIAREDRPIAIYAELLGKGLLYGIGGDFNFNKWLGIGATFSYYSLDWLDNSHLELGIIAPYVNFYPVGGSRHAMLLQAGPLLLLASAEMQDWAYIESGTGVAGFTSLNWEYRHNGGFLLRLGMTAFFGSGGWWLWPGLVLGGSF